MPGGLHTRGGGHGRCAAELQKRPCAIGLNAVMAMRNSIGESEREYDDKCLVVQGPGAKCGRARAAKMSPEIWNGGRRLHGPPRLRHGREKRDRLAVSARPWHVEKQCLPNEFHFGK